MAAFTNTASTPSLDVQSNIGTETVPVEVIVTLSPFSVPPVVGHSKVACVQVAPPPWLTAKAEH